MDVGKALKKVFDGKTFEYEYLDKIKSIKVNFHYGDQTELNNWIGIRNSHRINKYPLIFYVVDNNKKDYRDGTVTKNARILVLGLTKYNSLNDTRNVDVYEKTLNHVMKFVKKELGYNLNLQVLGKHGQEYKEVDYPLMSITSEDFTKYKSDNKQLTTIDIVDAKALDFKIMINLDCIK